ncbi:MAG: hypothetical protein ACTSUN_10430, partial [Promethearchaeota archaeon]
EEVIRQLRKQLSATMREISAIGRARSKQYREFDVDVNKQVRQKIKKRRGRNLVGGEINLLPHIFFSLEI